MKNSKKTSDAEALVDSIERDLNDRARDILDKIVKRKVEKHVRKVIRGADRD